MTFLRTGQYGVNAREVDSQGKFLLVLFAILIVLLGWLSFEVIRPFLSSIMWAIVLAIAFHPIHRGILRRVKKNGLASGLTLLIILLIILGPISYLGYRFVSELISVLGRLQGDVKQLGGVHNYISSLVDTTLSKVGVSGPELTARIEDSLSTMANSMGKELQEKTGEFFRISLDFFFMAIALFFVLRDGSGAVRRIIDRVPMSSSRKITLQVEVENIIAGSFYGNAISMGAHGALGLALFLPLGLPAPVLLAAAAALMSIIPAIGSLFVWAGALLYLIFKGRITAAIVMAVIAAVGTQVVDNWLRPYLVGSRVRIPFFTVFFGILGGMEFFGFVGLIVGPLILVLFQSIVSLSWQIWAERSVSE
jgi:predicted PurR-regulated permease PerM